MVHELTVIATATVLCAMFARILPSVREGVPDDEERFHAPPPSFLVLLALFVKGVAAAGFALAAGAGAGTG